MASVAPFLKTIESDLSLLSQESKRVLPSVTAAADSVAIEIRHANAALRSTVPVGHADTASVSSFTSRSGVTAATVSLDIDSHGGFLSQLIQPFILACNHSNAPKKVLTCALSAIQKFVTADAIPATEYGNIVRVLEIQADHGEDEVRLKVLQSLPLLLSQPSHYPAGRTVSSLLSLGFGFLRDRAPPIRHAAAATIQQTTALMFERADREARAARAARAATAVQSEKASSGAAVQTDKADPAKAASDVPLLQIKSDSASMAAACRLLLQDLVMVAGGLPPQWIKRSVPVPRVLAADLIDYVTREHSYLFHTIQQFRELIHSILVPLLLRQLPTQLSFPLFLRFARMTRSTLCNLHTAAPDACRALVSMLVRMVYAAARGEDFGATAARAMDRFGSAGTRILAEAHKRLGAPGSEEVPVLQTNVAFEGSEADLMQAVSTLPLGPMPLWKCVVMLEMLHSITLRPAVVCSLFVTFDCSLPSAEGPPKKDFQHLVEGVVLLLQRLIAAASRHSEGAEAETPRRQNRKDSRTSDADRVLRSNSGEGSTPDAEDAGLTDSDEFYFSLEDVEVATQLHSKRPLANLALADADAHIYASSTGGLQPAIALATAPTSSASAGGLLGFMGSMAGASVALVTAAASRMTEKDSVDATSLDTIAAPADLDPASLVLSCLEIVVNVATAAAVGSEAAAKSGNQGEPVSIVDIRHSHFSHGSLKDDSTKLHKPLLTTSGVAEGTSAHNGLNDVDSFPGTQQMAAMAGSLWKLIMSGLTSMLHIATTTAIRSYCLKAYQSFTYACGVLDLDLPRDALLVNLCRMSLPQWNPTAGVSSIAMTLLGSDSRSLPPQARNEITSMHLLVLKTLFNIAHCLGGVLGMSWIVVIDTFEQFDKLLESEGKAAFLRRRRQGPSADLSMNTAGLLLLVRGSDGSGIDSGSAIAPGMLPPLPKPSFDSAEEANLETPDDDMSVLGVALSTLFESTIYLPDKALADLVSALSDLSITALADSATSELADTPVAMLDSPPGRAHHSRAPSSRVEDAAPSKRPNSTNAVRQRASHATGVFSVEEAAADDARDIFAAESTADTYSDEVNVGPAIDVSPAAHRRQASSSRNDNSAGGLPVSKTAQPPFALTRLMETCMYNVWRLNAVWSPLNAMLRVLARSRSVAVRQYGLSACADIAIAHILRLGGPPKVKSDGSCKGTEHVVLANELLGPLFDYWRSPHLDARTDTILALNRIVEETGSSLVEETDPSPTGEKPAQGGWKIVLGLLHAVALLSLNIVSPPKGVVGKAVDSGSDMEMPSFMHLLPAQLFEVPDTHGSSLGTAAVQHLVSEAFRIVELISDDFMEKVPPDGLSYLLWLYSLFARQRFAMNVSLTTVSHIWKLLDFVMSDRHAVRPLREEVRFSLWLQGFQTLADLVHSKEMCSMPWLRSQSGRSGSTSLMWADVEVPPSKPEVRNAAVEVLFESLVSHGPSISSTMWKHIICDVVLPLIYHLTIVAQVNLAEDVKVEGEIMGKRRGEDSATDVKVVVHHSRDTVGKQWNETRVLAYQGLVKMVVACFSLLQPMTWFPDVWTEILAVIERSIVGKQSSSGGGAADEMILEPVDVSVPAIACLQKLALLVCVPGGVARPADDDDKYSFDMRVVDGALVRVTSPSVAPHAHRTIQPAGEPSPIGGALRRTLWEDIRSVLRGVAASPAVFHDEEENVAVAFIDLLTSLLTAAVISPEDITTPGEIMAFLSDDVRFTEVLNLIWKIFELRRQARWKHEAAVAGGHAIAGLYELPRLSTGTARSVIAEDLDGPRLEVVSNLERSLVRSLEVCFRSFFLLAGRTENQSGGAFEQRFSESWNLVFNFTCKLALFSDSAYAEQLLSQRAASCGHVNLPVSALALQAVKLLIRILVSDGRMDVAQSSSFPAAQCHSASGRVQQALHSALQAAIPALASSLLKHRQQSDAANSQIEKFESEAKPSTSRADSSSAPLDLRAVCDLMHFRFPDASYPSDGTTTKETARDIFPVKIWGFGLGGSYGPRGEGSLVMADLSKSKKNLQRGTTYTSSLVAALVACVGKGLHDITGTSGEPATADVWLTLLFTLRALVGFSLSSSADSSMPGVVRRGGHLQDSPAGVLRMLSPSVSVAKSSQPAERLRLLDGSLDAHKVDITAWNSFELAAAFSDEEISRCLLSGDAEAATRDSKASTASRKDPSGKSLFGATAACTDTIAGDFVKHDAFQKCSRSVGWKIFNIEPDTRAPGGRNAEMDAETFLLRAIVQGFCSSIQAGETSQAFLSLSSQLLLLLNAGTSVLGFNPFEDHIGETPASADKDGVAASHPKVNAIDSTSLRRLRWFSRMCFDAAAVVAAVKIPTDALGAETHQAVIGCFQLLLLQRTTDTLAIVPFLEATHQLQRIHAKTAKKSDFSVSIVTDVLNVGVHLDTLLPLLRASSAIPSLSDEFKAGFKRLYSVLCACISCSEPLIRYAVQQLFRAMMASGALAA